MTRTACASQRVLVSTILPYTDSIWISESVLAESFLLRAADRYAYTGCGSTAYCYRFYLGNEQILIDIGKPCRTSACLVRIAGPCPAEPFQLVPAHLGLSPARPYQLKCTSLRIATETRSARNTFTASPVLRLDVAAMSRGPMEGPAKS